MSNSSFRMAITLLFTVVFVCIIVASPQAQDVTKSDVSHYDMIKTNTDDTTAVKPVDPNGPKPKIEFESLTYDFGKKLSGADLSHSFVFHNRGNAPLLIEKVKAG